jgi:hypothetical protein
MTQKRNVVHSAQTLIPVSVILFAALSLGACSDRKPATTTAPATKSLPGPTPPVSTSTPTPTGPVIPPGTGEDVTKKGTSTGMVGGESGTVASSGKPGTGTDSGAGTGAAQSSDTKTADKK